MHPHIKYMGILIPFEFQLRSSNEKPFIFLRDIESQDRSALTAKET